MDGAQVGRVSVDVFPSTLSSSFFLLFQEEQPLKSNVSPTLTTTMTTLICILHAIAPTSVVRFITVGMLPSGMTWVCCLMYFMVHTFRILLMEARALGHGHGHASMYFESRLYSTCGRTGSGGFSSCRSERRIENPRLVSMAVSP
jgi:hypothetical protein